MEKLAREKIHAQQRIVSLKKELSVTWDHLDFGAMLPDHNSTHETNVNNKNGMIFIQHLFLIVH